MEHWTLELLLLMVTKMVERKERGAAAMRGEGSVADATGPMAALLPGIEYADKRKG